MHISRKLFHASGLVIVVLWTWLDVPRVTMAVILTAIALGSALVDVWRHRSPALQARFEKAFGRILDEKDLSGLNGTTLYFLGCALAAWITSVPAAKAGIVALAVGDSLAAIIGSSVRSPRWGRISVAGTGACFVAATLGARVWFAWPPALAAGAAAAVLEAFSGSKLDNLSIPVGAALVLEYWP